MKKTTVLLVVCLAGTLVCASADPQAKIRAATERASKAVIARDTDAILGSTYPGLIEQVGGRDSMREMLVENLKDLEARGLAVVSNEIVSISDAVQAGAEWHAVVRLKRTLEGAGGKQIHDTFLIAVSGDEGKNWTFVDGPQLTPAHIKILFPEFNPALELPATRPPVFEAEP